VSVEIIFRGVCLFRQERIAETNDLCRLKDVWIPRGKGGEHLDGSPAYPHYARLIVLDSFGNIVSRHALDDTVIEVTEGFGGDCLVQESFKSIPDFGAALEESGYELPKSRNTATPPCALLLKQSTPEFATAAASSISVSGGSISATPTRNSAWQSPAGGGKVAADLAGQATWRSQAPTATVRIHARDARGAKGRLLTEVMLDGNHPRAFIYNFDVEWPSMSMLSGMEEETPDVLGTADDDFKFLYLLVSGKRKNGGKVPLSAPTVRVAPDKDRLIARNPGSAGCYPGCVTC
jgi:hypothetical protein